MGHKLILISPWRNVSLRFLKPVLYGRYPSMFFEMFCHVKIHTTPPGGFFFKLPVCFVMCISKSSWQLKAFEHLQWPHYINVLAALSVPPTHSNEAGMDVLYLFNQLCPAVWVICLWKWCQLLKNLRYLSDRQGKCGCKKLSRKNESWISRWLRSLLEDETYTMFSVLCLFLKTVFRVCR